MTSLEAFSVVLAYLLRGIMANTTLYPEVALEDEEVEMVSSETGDCSHDRQWYAFLCSSLITFFAGLFLVLLGRVVSWLLCCGRGATAKGGDGAVRLVTATDDSRHANREDAGAEDGTQIGWATEAKDWAGELISGQSTTGRILVCDSCVVLHALSIEKPDPHLHFHVTLTNMAWFQQFLNKRQYVINI